MPGTPTNNGLYLSIAPVGGVSFEVMSLHAEESISHPFRYMVEVGSDDVGLDFASMLGQPVTVTIEHEDAAKNVRNGILLRLSQRLDESGRIIYILELVPWFQLLTFGSDCRIFQNKSVPDIIEAIFSECGRTDFKNSLTGTYTAREYCVQYNETHFDFISRLMEDEGIFYFFTHEDGKHTMVLADDIDAHQDCPGLTDPLKFMRFGTSWSEHDAVNSCVLEQRLVASGYQTSDYNFETPATSLHVKVDGKDKTAGGGTLIYEYPGTHQQKDAGEKRSNIRVEENELPIQSVHGASNSRHLLAGGKFKVKDHYRKDLNTSFVVRSLSMVVDQDRYLTNFEAFPATVQFRPPRVTRRPRVHGYQVATVVGKSGEEIWTDEYGRVKVSFPWDLRTTADETSSCWIRVAQPWAGKAWGTIAIPRIGTEVLVSFLDGDPDRPIITGTVYNGTQTVPYALPGEGTKTTIKTNSSKGGEGFNELRFEDKKGSEQIFIHGEKDLDLRIKNDAREFYGNEHHMIVTKNALAKMIEERHTTITKDDLVKIDGSRHVTITKDDKEKISGDKHLTVAADYKQKVDGTASLKVGMDLQEKVGMNYAVDAGMEVHLKGGMNVIIEAGMSVTLKAGGGFIVVGPAGVTISGTPVLINSGGSAGSGSGASPDAPAAPTAPQEPTEAADDKAGQVGEAPPAGPGNDNSGSGGSGGGGGGSSSSGGGSSGGGGGSSSSAASSSSSSSSSSAAAASAAPAAAAAATPAATVTPAATASPVAAAQAETLKQAAENGTPFCEKCEEARRQREAEAAGQGSA